MMLVYRAQIRPSTRFSEENYSDMYGRTSQFQDLGRSFIHIMVLFHEITSENRYFVAKQAQFHRCCLYIR